MIAKGGFVQTLEFQSDEVHSIWKREILSNIM